MVHHKVHHQLHITLLEPLNELVNVPQRAILWINVLIVRDIITHVNLWAFVYWGEVRENPCYNDKVSYLEISKLRRLFHSSVSTFLNVVVR